MVRVDIVTTTHNNPTPVAFRISVSFTKRMIKVDGITIDYAEESDSLMSMYNLIKNSTNYSDTTGSLWFYSKNEAANFNAEIMDTNNFKCFKYRTKLWENTVAGANKSILKMPKPLCY